MTYVGSFINEAQTGNYEEGIFNGKGLYTYNNKENYEGEYINGENHGRCKFVLKKWVSVIYTFDNGNINWKAQFEKGNGKNFDTEYLYYKLIFKSL